MGKRNMIKPIHELVILESEKYYERSYNKGREAGEDDYKAIPTTEEITYGEIPWMTF